MSKISDFPVDVGLNALNQRIADLSRQLESQVLLIKAYREGAEPLLKERDTLLKDRAKHTADALRVDHIIAELKDDNESLHTQLANLRACNDRQAKLLQKFSTSDLLWANRSLNADENNRVTATEVNQRNQEQRLQVQSLHDRIDAWRARAVSAENRNREIGLTSAAVWKDRALYWEKSFNELKAKIAALTK